VPACWRSFFCATFPKKVRRTSEKWGANGAPGAGNRFSILSKIHGETDNLVGRLKTFTRTFSGTNYPPWNVLVQESKRYIRWLVKLAREPTCRPGARCYFVSSQMFLQPRPRLDSRVRSRHILHRHFWIVGDRRLQTILKSTKSALIADTLMIAVSIAVSAFWADALSATDVRFKPSAAESSHPLLTSQKEMRSISGLFRIPPGNPWWSRSRPEAVFRWTRWNRDTINLWNELIIFNV